MSRTTPVRWWRDDGDRYRSRGAYVAPPASGPEWILELLAPLVLPLDPEMTRILGEMRDSMRQASRFLGDDPWGTRALRERRIAVDPLADVRRALGDGR